MRRPSLLAACVLLLASCGGGAEGGGTGVACVSQYWDGTLGVCLPSGWKVLPAETLRENGVPEETIVAFQATDARDGQFDTITITREPLPEDMDALTYSEDNVLAVSTLPEYQLLDKRDLKIDDNDSQLHIFSARPVAEKPVRRYYQVSSTREREGFTITGSLPLSVPEGAEASVVSILQSLTFKNPQEQAAE